MTNTYQGLFVEFGSDTVAFDNSIKGVNRAIRTAANELGNINKQLKLDPKNVELLERKMSTLKKGIDLTKRNLEAYKQELNDLPASDVGGPKWERLKKQIANAETSVKQYEAALSDTETQMKRVASIDFKKTGENIKGMGDKLTPVSVAAGAAAGALGAVAVKAGAAADDINTLASVTGMSTETIQEFAYMSDIVDVSMQDLTKANAKLTKSLATVKKDGDPVAQIMKDLGVNLYDSSGKMRKSNEIMFDTLAALGQMEEGVERDNIAMKLFGKSAQALNPVIETGAEGMSELAKEAHGVGAVLSQDQLDKLNGMNDVFDRLKSTLAGVALQLGTKLADALKPMLDVIPKITDALSKFVQSLPPSFVAVVLGVLLALAALAPVLMAIGATMTLMAPVITALTAATGLALGPILAIVAAVIATIAVFAVLYAKCKSFRSAINALAKVLAGVVAGAFKIVWNVIKALVPVVTTLAKFFGSLLLVAILGVVAAIKLVVSWIKKMWDKFKNTKFGQGVIDFFKTLVSWIQKAVSWVGDLINKFTNSVLGKGISSLSKFISGNGSSGFGDTGGFGAVAGFGASGGYGSIVLNASFAINNTGGQLTTENMRSLSSFMIDQLDEHLGRRI